MSDVSRRPRPRHAIFGFVFVVAAALVLSVSPASAKNRTLTAALTGAPLGKFCGFTAPAGFSSLARLTTTSSAARGSGDVAREPSPNQTVEELPANAKGKGGQSFRATVPVYFHVVHAGGVGDISQTIIDEQMNVLNLAVAGFYGGVNTGFKFKLVGVTRTDNA